MLEILHIGMNNKREGWGKDLFLRFELQFI